MFQLALQAKLHADDFFDLARWLISVNVLLAFRGRDILEIEWNDDWVIGLGHDVSKC